MIRGILIPVLLFILLLSTGTIAYHEIEGWRYIDATYFSVMTMTTIGYGDFSPSTDIGKIFTIFYAFSGIGIAFYFFTLVGRYFLIKQKRGLLMDEGRLKSSRGIRKIK